MRLLSIILILTVFFIKGNSQNLYKNAHTLLGKSKHEIVAVKGANYEYSNDGDIFYLIPNPTGIKPGAIRYSFINDQCKAVIFVFNSSQLQAVSQYLNEIFKFEEVKIPGTELWVKLWVETEDTGRYTWSFTDKESLSFLSVMFYKK